MSLYPNLLSASQIGDIDIPNKVLMSAMTRFRVTEAGVPTALNGTYYAQRASAGLIATETVYCEPQGRLTPRTAGLYTREQLEAWKHVTATVKCGGGRIFVQLSHAGRTSHPALQPNNELPVAPSAIAKVGQVRVEENEADGVVKADAVVPRALTLREIPALVQSFKKAAERAVEAGFDGVELHAGSGLLHQQFLTTGSNQRIDRYGGSALNRCRFVIETLEAMSEVRGSQRVGLKLAPNFAYNGNEMTMTEMEETYTFLGPEIERLNLAYVHVMFPPWGLFIGPADFDPIDFMRARYRGPLVGGGEFDRHTGENAIAAGRCDFVAFGRRFLANPDLPERFRIDAPENGWNEATLYTPTAEGFTDYPTLTE